MLAVVFYIGEERYALEARRIVEILPLVRLKRLPQAPLGLLGVLDHKGALLPVVDLTWLALGTPALARFGTRIVIFELDPTHPVRRVGLLVERLYETVTLEGSWSTTAGTEAVPWLGQVMSTSGGLLQQVNPETAVGPEIQAALSVWLKNEGTG